jgi:hypothetical protein
MSTSDVIAGIAVLIASATLAFHISNRRADARRAIAAARSARQEDLIRALQGDMASVGYEAYRVGTDGWPESPAESRALCDALCLSAVFEKSDRSRALIYRALRKIPPQHAEDLRATIDELERIFDPVRSLGDGLDVERGRRRLRSLAANVGTPIPEDATPTRSGSERG